MVDNNFKGDNKFSVVMSVYKKDKLNFLKQAVDSVLNQTLKSNEFIIVVDGSVGEDIYKYLTQLEAKESIIEVVYLKQNKGLANALNVGISKTNYNIIARMDADDICFPDRFQKQLNFLIKEDLDIVGGQIIEFGDTIKDVISQRNVPTSHQQIINQLKVKSPLSHPTIVFKKEIFEKTGGYDAKIFPEDYDFFVRASMLACKFGNVKDSVLWFRLGNDTNAVLKRRHGIKYAKNEYKLYEKFLKMGYYNLFEFIKVIAIKIPLRLLPFPLFKYLYYNLFRKI